MIGGGWVGDWWWLGGMIGGGWVGCMSTLITVNLRVCAPPPLLYISVTECQIFPCVFRHNQSAILHWLNYGI